MERSITFLVERVPPFIQGLIYQIDAVEREEFVRLVQNGFDKFNPAIMVGSVVKRNKRGLTFNTYAIAPKGLQVFLSNSDFDVLNKDEFAEWRARDLDVKEPQIL